MVLVDSLQWVYSLWAVYEKLVDKISRYEKKNLINSLDHDFEVD